MLIFFLNSEPFLLVLLLHHIEVEVSRVGCMDFEDGTWDASRSHLNYGLVCSELLGYRLIRLIEEGDNTLVG